MYADDTAAQVISPKINEIETKLSRDMNLITRWCDQNSMCVNSQKTKVIVIGTTQKKARTKNHINVMCGNDQLDCVTHEKLLGVTIDDTLNWEKQVNSVCSKVAFKLLHLKRIRPFLTQRAKMIFYNCFILPHFDYCSNIWGHCSNKLLLRVERLQKAVARVLLDSDFSTPSRNLFDVLNWLPFRERIVFNESVLMYKVQNNLAPNYLNVFRSVQNVHSRSTRSVDRNELYIPRHRTQIFKRSFTYSGVKIWNSLPADVKFCSTLHSFKTKCKSHLLGKM